MSTTTHKEFIRRISCRVDAVFEHFKSVNEKEFDITIGYIKMCISPFMFEKFKSDCNKNAEKKIQEWTRDSTTLIDVFRDWFKDGFVVYKQIAK